MDSVQVDTSQRFAKRSRMESAPITLITNTDITEMNIDNIPQRFFIYNSESKVWFLLVGPSRRYSLSELVDSSILLNNWDYRKVYKIYYDGKRYVRHPNGEVEMTMNMEADYDDHIFEDQLDFCGCLLQLYREDWLVDFPASFVQKVPARKDGTPYQVPVLKNAYATIDFIKSADLDDLNYNGL